MCSSRKIRSTFSRLWGADSVTVPRKVIIREMRGIPHFLLCEYLVEMGGMAVSADVIEAPHWRVTLEKMELFRIGSLAVGQNRLTIEIDPAEEESFFKVFSIKTFRAGG